MKKPIKSMTGNVSRTSGFNGSFFAENPGIADKRAKQLLDIFREIEQYEDRMSDAQLTELLYHAALACGFADPREGWNALMGLILSGHEAPNLPHSYC